ncbi:MAG TPA: hypothetical protein VHX14_06905 [Thermoanaerobaculia bacterium]|jgi:uncharacterized membrane protein|nr:hypothetical protein [Thermoanaerobaculia bacterium]
MSLLNAKTSTLFCCGLAALAMRGTLQLLLDRTGHSNNTIDFLLGVIFGIGIGLLILVAWQSGRKGRGQSNGASAR